MEAKSIKLYFREGSSDKVYNASLEKQIGGWVVNFSYGRRGTALQSGTKTPTPIDYDKALKVYTKLVAEKTGKGYQEEGGSGSSGPATPTLSASLPSKDTGLRPQLLNEITEQEVEKYITDPNWCAQEKFDGKRRMLLKEGLRVVATNRKGLVTFPSDKITSAVAKLTDGDLTLDGEDMGDYVMVFDILKLGHKDLSKEGFKDRDKELKALIKPGINELKTVYTAYTTGEKRMLYEKLKKHNAEGIVFKHTKSKYVPGRPNSYGYQLKFKFVTTASCIVTEISDVKKSISLAVYDENGELKPVGSATVYPSQITPPVGSVVEVRYLYYFKNGSLFQPVLIGTGDVTRDDIDPEACVIGQLKVKRGEVDADYFKHNQ
jgi:bifunctional non-homologous end joining protein LigD